MRATIGSRLRWLGRSGLWLCLFTGCAIGKDHAAVQTSRIPTTAPREVSEQYRASCPDVLEVSVGANPSVRAPINPDGRIALAALGAVRVEGLSCDRIERRIAASAGLPMAEVHVRVAEFKSQEVYIFGEVNGLQRAVPYRGRETVLELLQRAGGLGEGAEPADVYVVRAHVADGRPSEVFPIKLGAASSRDERTAVKLEPFDQVYIGETRRWSFRKCLPPWLQPLYESLWGMKPEKKS